MPTNRTALEIETLLRKLEELRERATQATALHFRVESGEWKNIDQPTAYAEYIGALYNALPTLAAELRRLSAQEARHAH